MERLLRKIRKFCMSKSGCIYFGIMFMIGSICSLFFINDVGVFAAITSIAAFVSSLLFFAAASDEYDEKYVPPPFFYSLDKDGNLIMTDGEKTIPLEKPKEESQSADMGLYDSVARELVLFEIELEEDGKEVTPYRKLSFLKKLFCDDRFDLKRYKEEKNIIFLIDLDNYFEEIDLQEGDNKAASDRKLRYLQTLFEDNLIDTEEYETLKSEILEEISE